MRVSKVCIVAIRAYPGDMLQSVWQLLHISLRTPVSPKDFLEIKIGTGKYGYLVFDFIFDLH